VVLLVEPLASVVDTVGVPPPVVGQAEVEAEVAFCRRDQAVQDKAT